MKAILDSLDDVPEAFHEQYVEGDDGRFTLKIEGDVPGFSPTSKVDEFRTTNRALHDQAEASKKEAADLAIKFKDIDPTKYAEMTETLAGLEKKKITKADDLPSVVAAAVKPLRDALESLREDNTKKDAAIARSALESKVRAAGVAGGVADTAMEDFLHRGMGRFELNADGQATHKNGLVDDVGNPVTLDSFVSDLRTPAPHLFKASGGAGADGGDGKNLGVGGTKTADLSDSKTFGDNLEAVASGELRHAE